MTCFSPATEEEEESLPPFSFCQEKFLLSHRRLVDYEAAAPQNICQRNFLRLPRNAKCVLWVSSFLKVCAEVEQKRYTAEKCAPNHKMLLHTLQFYYKYFILLLLDVTRSEVSTLFWLCPSSLSLSMALYLLSVHKLPTGKTAPGMPSSSSPLRSFLCLCHRF